MRAVLKVLFRDGDRVIAKLSIAAKLYRAEPQSGCDIDYIDSDGSLGIRYISNESDIDERSPFQIYSGNDVSIFPILLLEDTPYEMELTSDYDLDAVFPFLRENSGDISIRDSYFSDDRRRIFNLNFIGYVGRGFLDLVSSGKRYSIPFEVRSRKLGYRSEYPQMLSDISDFSTSMLLQMKSPLFRYYSIKEGKSRSGYEDFLVLDYIFGHLRLQEMYEYVRNNPDYNTETYTENVPVELAGIIDDIDMVSLTCGDNLVRMDGGPIRGLYAPRTVDEIRYEDDYDTPENRVVKDLLLTVRHMSYSLLKDIPGNASDYVRGRLEEFLHESERMSADGWLADVGELRMIPFESTVLQNGHGYAELFQAYQILGLGALFEQSDMEGLLEGHGSRVSEVYEYWCYTRLYLCLKEMSSNRPEFPQHGRNGVWNISIRDESGIGFDIPCEGSDLHVRLYYNKGFGPRNSSFRSYSIGLRPDYTLSITKDGDDRRFIVNFDAKYKLKPVELDDADTGFADETSECWKQDLYKMHTYRDALLQCYGSYVLYPGKTDNIFVKPGPGMPWEGHKEGVIPSIGSIQLLPGSDAESLLTEQISKVLRKIVGMVEGETMIDEFYT